VVLANIKYHNDWACGQERAEYLKTINKAKANNNKILFAYKKGNFFGDAIRSMGEVPEPNSKSAVAPHKVSCQYVNDKNYADISLSCTTGNVYISQIQCVDEAGMKTTTTVYCRGRQKPAALDCYREGLAMTVTEGASAGSASKSSGGAR
jgi:hypothetical protein